MNEMLKLHTQFVWFISVVIPTVGCLQQIISEEVLSVVSSLCDLVLHLSFMSSCCTLFLLFD